MNELQKQTLELLRQGADPAVSCLLDWLLTSMTAGNPSGEFEAELARISERCSGLSIERDQLLTEREAWQMAKGLEEAARQADELARQAVAA